MPRKLAKVISLDEYRRRRQAEGGGADECSITLFSFERDAVLVDPNDDVHPVVFFLAEDVGIALTRRDARALAKALQKAARSKSAVKKRGSTHPRG